MQPANENYLVTLARGKSLRQTAYGIESSMECSWPCQILSASVILVTRSSGLVGVRIAV
jgi:hypothetical protein